MRRRRKERMEEEDDGGVEGGRWRRRMIEENEEDGGGIYFIYFLCWFIKKIKANTIFLFYVSMRSRADYITRKGHGERSRRKVTRKGRAILRDTGMNTEGQHKCCSLAFLCP